MSVELVIGLLALVAVLLAVLVLWARRRPAVVAAPGGLTGRLGKSRRALGAALAEVFGRERLDWQSLEDALISADVGVAASARLVERVRGADPPSAELARRELSRRLVEAFGGRDRSLSRRGQPSVVLVVGVNGAGKTTSIAKLAKRFADEGVIPLLGSADTFRAAADTQLRVWADRVGVEVVGGRSGADPAAVAYDAFQAARARGAGVVIIDTAGRLQSKEHLMAELGKIRRVLEREAGGIDEVLLVLDATLGQNGLAQVRQFATAVGVTGIILTKLDGTARGGIVVAVEEDLGVPVKLVGIGEGVDDLLPFDPEEFVSELLAEA